MRLASTFAWIASGLVVSLTLGSAACGGGDDLIFGSGATVGASSSSSSAGGAGGTGPASSSVVSSSSAASSGGAGGEGGSAPVCNSDDLDDDGVSECDGDCNDDDPLVRPGASEICGDGVANDCTGPTDPASCKGLGTFVSFHTGDDNNPGTKDKPLATIEIALNQSVLLNKQPIFVANGKYSPKNAPNMAGTAQFVLQEGISLFGGYRCDKVECSWARNPKVFPSRLEASDPWGLFIPGGVTNKTVVEGFEIDGFTGGSNANGVVSVTIQGAPTLRGNRILGATGNSGNAAGTFVMRFIAAPSGAETAKISENQIVGGPSTTSSFGIHLMNQGRADIEKNDIRAGQSFSSRAVLIAGNAGAVKLSRNAIAAGGCSGSTAFAVQIGAGAKPLIESNLINTDPAAIGNCTACASGLTGIGATWWCGGIESSGSAAVITNNVIQGMPSNRSVGILFTDCEGNCVAGSPIVNSNTIVGGGAAGGVSAAMVWKGYKQAGSNLVSGRARNNILLAGSGGTRMNGKEEAVVGATARPEKLEFNDLWGATGALYVGWAGVDAPKMAIDDVNMLQGAQKNIAVDPALDATWHLTTDACVDLGGNEETPIIDRDGETRPKGAGFDIGADEYK
ncbi:MAG: putative metal-binding motif-containing protein [Deltaproteobacteria bacterium]|nr:putative metal-binding motif-containing protein [Deltaproteobacteria bacterium]